MERRGLRQQQQDLLIFFFFFTKHGDALGDIQIINMEDRSRVTSEE